jgi:hypothetical protein
MEYLDFFQSQIESKGHFIDKSKIKFDKTNQEIVVPVNVIFDAKTFAGYKEMSHLFSDRNLQEQLNEMDHDN